MNLPKLSVDRPVTVVMVILIILLLGFVSFTSLSIDLLPEMNLPIVIIYTEYPGAGPAEVENLVTRPIEQVVGTVRGLDTIESVSSVGSSMVVVQFGWGTDINQAANDLREQLDLISGYLPDAAQKPMVFKMDPNLIPVVQLGATGGFSSADLKTLLEDKVVPRLERIEGVASVVLTGGDTREIRLEVDPAKLSYYGLTLPQLLQSMQGDNVNLSGGSAGLGDRELLVRIKGEFKSVDEIGEVTVATPFGTWVRLKDLGEIVDTYREKSQLSRLNGQDAIGINISKQTGANTVQVSREIRKTLAEIEKDLPGDVSINTLFDQAEYIEFSIRNMTQNMVTGGILAVLILFIFLRNVPTTMIIALAMPVSVIATFTMVYFGGITLNIMSLGGLALGLGMMVDNSIVILENIYRHREAGLSIKEAAVTGANEVGNAIVASTLTTIAVFFPIVFVEGLASQLFREFALTISFSLFASLLVALTVVPMFSSRMMKITPLDQNGEAGGSQAGLRGFWRRVFAVWGTGLHKLEVGYRQLLAACLRRRRRVILVVTLIVVASLVLVPVIGAEFIPAMDQGYATVNISLPYGSKLEATREIAGRVEEIIQSIPEVDLVFTAIGADSTGLGGAGPAENASIAITLKPLSQRERKTDEVVDEIWAKVQDIPGAEISVSGVDASAMMGHGMAPVQVRVEGDDLEVLTEIAKQIKTVMESIPGTREVEIGTEEGRPELALVVDRAKAAQYGLSTAQIVSTVQTAMQGQTITRYKEAGEEIDVKIMFPKELRENVAHLSSIEFLTPSGLKVPLGEVAELNIEQGPTDINRRNQTRYIPVTCQISGRDLNSVMNDINYMLEEQLQLPDGYAVEMGGSAEEMVKAFSSLTKALLLAIALVYMIMAAQFESFLHPFVIMFSMPVAIVGVILGLLVTGSTFNVISFIGLIMLAGIVVNNAIVLVDYVNTLRKRGMARDEAILVGGQTRLRPILMTTLTTVLAMLPLMFEAGEGGEAGAPLAAAVVGGLTTSTLLTLVLVPVVYSIFDDWGQRIMRRRKAKLENRKGVEAACGSNG